MATSLLAMTSSRRLCVRLLSGVVVYDGPRPVSLAKLRDEVATTLDLKNKDELIFCSGDAVVNTILDAGEQITVMRDQVMGLLEEFLQHVNRSLRYVYDELPEHLWPAREHRGLITTAVKRSSLALQYASADLRNDRDVVMAAVENDGLALQHASAKPRADRDVVLAAVERNGLALRHASAEVQADRDVVLAAVKNNSSALLYAHDELRCDRDFVLVAVERNDRALLYAPAEFRHDQYFVRAAVERNGRVIWHVPSSSGWHHTAAHCGDVVLGVGDRL